jgi:uncharacterized protein with HEPN domain
VKADTIYLRHILDAILKIEGYVSVGLGRFMAESHWQDATIRQLEVIGEATKQLSEELRSKHSKIPWRRISGMRDVLIHNYMGVDLNAVWEVTQRYLPELKFEIENILQRSEEETPT